MGFKKLTHSQEIFLATVLQYGFWTAEVANPTSPIKTHLKLIGEVLVNGKYSTMFDDILLNNLVTLLKEDNTKRKLNKLGDFVLNIDEKLSSELTELRLKYDEINVIPYKGGVSSLINKSHDVVSFMEVYSKIKEIHDKEDDNVDN